MLVVPLAPGGTSGKARPMGIYPAGVLARTRYLENRR